MGAQSTNAALTETGGGPAPDGTRLYVGIDVGRRHHLVVAIPRQRMENASWEHAAARKIATNGDGFRDLAGWLESFELEVEQVRIACEPTGGWYARTVVSWLEGYGYRVDWLQNWALHERRQLAIGKQTKTDALDARLIARLLYERDLLGMTPGFLHRPPRNGHRGCALPRGRHAIGAAARESAGKAGPPSLTRRVGAQLTRRWLVVTVLGGLQLLVVVAAGGVLTVVGVSGDVAGTVRRWQCAVVGMTNTPARAQACRSVVVGGRGSTLDMVADSRRHRVCASSHVIWRLSHAIWRRLSQCQWRPTINVGRHVNATALRQLRATGAK